MTHHSIALEWACADLAALGVSAELIVERANLYVKFLGDDTDCGQNFAAVDAVRFARADVGTVDNVVHVLERASVYLTFLDATERNNSRIDRILAQSERANSARNASALNDQGVNAISGHG